MNGKLIYRFVVLMFVVKCPCSVFEIAWLQSLRNIDSNNTDQRT